MNDAENQTVRRIPIEKAITIEEIARELFNELQGEDKYEISKNRDIDVFLFDVRKRGSSLLKLAVFHYEMKIYGENNTCVCEFTNKDTESQLVKYTKSFLIGGGFVMLDTQKKLDEVRDFPAKIESMIKTIIAKH